MLLSTLAALLPSSRGPVLVVLILWGGGTTGPAPLVSIIFNLSVSLRGRLEFSKDVFEELRPYEPSSATRSVLSARARDRLRPKSRRSCFFLSQEAILPAKLPKDGFLVSEELRLRL